MEMEETRKKKKKFKHQCNKKRKKCVYLAEFHMEKM